MALSRTTSIGIDPAYRIEKEIHCDVQLARVTSDDFFALPDPLAHFDHLPIDLAFIDGMHLAEFAVRDFMHVERHMADAGAILIDDVLPRSDLEAARDRQTSAWTGDVFKLLMFLLELRPDLTIIPLNTRPTGTVLVLGIDPESRVLEHHYPELLRRCQSRDPQHVPDEILNRSAAFDPIDITMNSIWPALLELRNGSADRQSVKDTISERLAQLISPQTI